MKRSVFPEKLYESMFIHELLVHFSKTGQVPISVPSQVAENKVGYDLCFVDNSGKPINRKVMLIQFKVAHLYEGKNCQWDFKFDIYKAKGLQKYKQHNLLCKYNLKHGNKIAGVYCAPEFVEIKDFYEKVKSSRIIADSLLFRPVKKIRDDENHCIKYGSAPAEQFSKEGTEIETTRFESMVQELESLNLEEFESLIESVKYETDDDELVDELDNPEEFADGDWISHSSYYLFI